MSLSVSILHPASPTAPPAARTTLILTHAFPFLLIETQPRHSRQHR
jgi:hypothetical protein